MRNDRELDRRKEICSESSVLEIGPCETFILNRHEMVEEIAFVIPQEIVGVDFIDCVLAFLGVATCRSEFRRVHIECGHFGKRISIDLVVDAELWGYSGDNRSNFLSYRLILLLLLNEIGSGQVIHGRNIVRFGERIRST